MHINIFDAVTFRYHSYTYTATVVAMMGDGSQFFLRMKGGHYKWMQARRCELVCGPLVPRRALF